MEPRIIFEDSEILVLDKPAGIVVNRSDTTVGEKTVQEWVEAHLVIPSLFRDPCSNEMLKRVQHDTKETDFYKRAGIVHRLDKETSGILLVAKNPQSFENLQKQFKERRVKKTYIALVHGKVEFKEGEINVPVGRLPWNRKRFGVLAGGREAVTRYKVLRSVILSSAMQNEGSNEILRFAQNDRGAGDIKNESLTLLELYPETGRTHQIRVHLKYLNHSIFADPLYAGRKTARNDRKILPRIFLHASKISFYHPKTGKLIYFESELPNQLRQFLGDLQHS
ncbi:MAG: RluA family pseudouridine synthase [Patescibacteria group bacterium]